MAEDVLFSTNKNGVATILLNRPKALNSLNLTMVDAIGKKLEAWATDQNIQCVVIKGAGERGLCAGGDIKTLYSAKESQENLEEAYEFFTIEYDTDLAVANFPKPIIAILDGIVMGGGVGLISSADFKIVTERTTWAMPETSIGFFPDVGAAYFLNKAPGKTGRYLGLTGLQLKAADILYINGANYYMPSEKLPAFLQQIEEDEFTADHIQATIKNLLDEFSTIPPNNGVLSKQQQESDQHFSYATVEEILSSLEADSSTFAKKTKETLLSKSPVSLKVTLKHLINSEQESLASCLATDLTLAKNFMKHPDFFEGVRSVIIDKDHQPNYQYATLEDVPNELVHRFFKE